MSEQGAPMAVTLWSLMKIQGRSALEVLSDPQRMRADITVWEARRKQRNIDLALIEDPLARAIHALTLIACED